MCNVLVTFGDNSRLSDAGTAKRIETNLSL